MIRLKYALKSILKGCSRQNTKADEVTAKMKKIRLEMLASRLRWYSLAVNRPLTHGRIKRRVRLNRLTRRWHIVCRAVWTNLDGTVSSTVAVSFVVALSVVVFTSILPSDTCCIVKEESLTTCQNYRSMRTWAQSVNSLQTEVREDLSSLCELTTNIGHEDELHVSNTVCMGPWRPEPKVSIRRNPLVNS